MILLWCTNIMQINDIHEFTTHRNLQPLKKAKDRMSTVSKRICFAFFVPSTDEKPLSHTILTRLSMANFLLHG